MRAQPAQLTRGDAAAFALQQLYSAYAIGQEALAGCQANSQAQIETLNKKLKDMQEEFEKQKIPKP